MIEKPLPLSEPTGDHGAMLAREAMSGYGNIPFLGRTSNQGESDHVITPTEDDTLGGFSIYREQNRSKECFSSGPTSGLFQNRLA